MKMSRFLQTYIFPFITVKHREIQNITNNYDESFILRRGTFGTIYKAQWKNKAVAVKMPNTNCKIHKDSTLRKMIRNELLVLRNRKHSNIITLHDFSFHFKPGLIYEFMPNGNLRHKLSMKNSKPLTWIQRSKIAEGIARGLNYLHTAKQDPLIHMNIKSSNILLDNDLNPKISDFSLAKEGMRNGTIVVKKLRGTFFHLPCEYVSKKQLSTKVDVYSYGLILLELATGLPVMDTRRSPSFLKNYIDNYSQNGEWEALMDPRAGSENKYAFIIFIGLGDMCSITNPRARPEMIQIYEYFSSLNEDFPESAQSNIPALFHYHYNHC